MAAEAETPLPRPAPRLFAWRFRWWVALPLLLATAALAAGAGYMASEHYPQPAPPPPGAIEAHAVAVFGLPVGTADGVVAGDLLVERFYAIDVENGEHYVGDVLKGRIQALQSAGPKGAGPYTLVLDLRNLLRDRALYAAFVEEVARPQGNYLGLRVLPGVSDAFPINYNGFIPPERAVFRGPDGENAYEFLLKQTFMKVTAEPRAIGVDGYNFLMNSSDRFSFFNIEFRTGKAIFLSELLLIDTTGRSQKATMFRLQEQYKKR